MCSLLSGSIQADSFLLELRLTMLNSAFDRDIQYLAMFEIKVYRRCSDVFFEKGASSFFPLRLMVFVCHVHSGSRMVLLTLEVEGGLVVFAGSILQAKVIVDQPQTDEKELEITLTGQGETGWTEQESSYDAASKKHVTRSRHYKQVEEYLTVQKTLWSKATGSSLSSRQSFDFSINLPPDLPPSFKGTYGSISYSIAAKLKRPMLKFDKEARETLIIVPLCSMAHLRELMEPVKLQKDKQLEVLFWKKGHIHATVNLPRRVHVLGETIPITAEIHNQSSVVVKKTDAKLIQTVTFHCSGRKKEETSNVVRIKRGNVLPGTIFQWNNVSMVIPKSIPPSDFGPRCRLFQAQHKFQFTVVPTGLHFSLDLVTDVKLGSVWQHPPVVVPGQQVPVTPLGNQFPAMHFPVSPQGVPQGPFVGMPYMSPQPGPFPVQPGVQYSPVPPQMPGYPFPPAGPGMAPPYAMPDAPNFVASAPPSDGNLYPSVNFEAPPTYNQACGTSDANNFRPSPDDDELTKDFEKIKM
ncbi:unnamed protein product [Notodromas monacha]|uniref:Arrestin C-terminal-like domain-containing protein n=1 Tax=Notodromas monacha TaxID=399045 RepID=A0A7R9GF66_9CRUS|nr:unnamed protein product [Notodromas monacha]CAG0920472.1 unnamed protein product [Notodromas monacha]